MGRRIAYETSVKPQSASSSSCIQPALALHINDAVAFTIRTYTYSSSSIVTTNAITTIINQGGETIF
jgi:hypothetical protein